MVLKALRLAPHDKLTLRRLEWFAEQFASNLTFSGERDFGLIFLVRAVELKLIYFVKKPRSPVLDIFGKNKFRAQTKTFRTSSEIPEAQSSHKCRELNKVLCELVINNFP